MINKINRLSISLTTLSVFLFLISCGSKSSSKNVEVSVIGDVLMDSVDGSMDFIDADVVTEIEPDTGFDSVEIFTDISDSGLQDLNFEEENELIVKDSYDAEIADMSGKDIEWLKDVSCKTEPPPDAVLAAPPPAYSGGICPELVSGKNKIMSKGNEREFILVVPSDPEPEESFPVLAMWYWLKGSAKSFLEKGEVQQASDQQRFIAIIPESKKDIDLFGVIELPWPFTTFMSQSRMEEEFVFFDDMFACVSEQLKVNKECVSAVGVSAGALYAVQLAGYRSQYLSSFISLSGGTKSKSIVNSFILPWVVPVHKLPAIVLWGGPYDSCITLNFQEASMELEDQLIAGNHFFIECIHNCKHGEPPLEPPPGKSKYAAIWEFAFAHPFWLKPGESPYLAAGVASDYISWCGIGKDSAIPRDGPCPPPGCPF
jgi:hypothetical protein